MGTEPTHGDLYRLLESRFERIEDGIQRVHERVDAVKDDVAHVRQETARQAEAITHALVETERAADDRKAIRDLIDRTARELKSGLAALAKRVTGIEKPLTVLRAFGIVGTAIVSLAAAGLGIFWTVLQIIKHFRTG